MTQLGCRAEFFPPAVDSRIYRPATAAEKKELRRRYGISEEGPVVTHVGHIRLERNLACLLDLRHKANLEPVIVGSTSSEQDDSLKEDLRRAGAIVLDHYIEKIEDVFRLSDVYVFLARQENQAIEVPLSVLEAMACNLPVVCTPFGGLPDFFKDGPGLFYWDGSKQIVDCVRWALTEPCHTRSLVEPLTWEAAAGNLVSHLAGGRKTP
jgi:glycosyltransferase involved in cell wall biosynthesis